MVSQARRIVVKAAAQVEDAFTKSALTEDSRGFFEKEASKLLEKVASKAAELKLSEEDTENQVATVLGLHALKATIHQARKAAKTTKAWQPKTGAACYCKAGIARDNCANCEGTGRAIDFAAIRARKVK